MHMVDLMSSIICEGDTVSQELLDTVLVNLVPAHKVRALCGVSKAHQYSSPEFIQKISKFNSSLFNLILENTG